MRFRMSLEIISPVDANFEELEYVLPMRYQSTFLSVLKRGLEAMSPEYYQQLYVEKNQEKLFSQALIFHGAVFSKEEIHLKTKNITWLWSSPLADLSMAFYNAFAYLKQQKAIQLTKEIQIRVKSIAMTYQDTIKENSVDFKLASPLIVRDHNRETKKDWFLSFEDENFETVLKANLKRKLIPHLGESVQYDIDNLKFEPLNMKKSVTKIYEKFCQSSLGSIRVTGEPYLLNFIRDASFSSRSGLFNGYLDQLGVGR
ncbi:CRISPR-associated endoribonuclease Cas6 [Enterococcus sp. LJL120]